MAITRLFPLMYISCWVIIAALFATGVTGIVNYSNGLLFQILMIVEYLLLISVIISAWGKYAGTLDRINTDIEGFIDEQGRYSKRARGSIRYCIDNNLAVGLIRYERYDEAEALLRYANQNVRQCPLRYRYIWLNNYMCTMMAKGNYSEAQNVLAEMEKMFPAVKTFWKKDYAAMRSFIDRAHLELQFIQLSPEQLETTHKELCQKLYEQYVALANRLDNSAMRESSLTSVKFKAAACLVFLGRADDARAIFDEIASLDYTFPIIARTREYLQTGDKSLLVKYAG